MTVWAIIVAGGSGTRFGRPKQYEVIAGRSVLERSVQAARQHCDAVVVVLPPGDDLPPDVPADRLAAGGATRSESVRAGLAQVPDDASVVVVHDAARPLASPALFGAVIAAVRDGAEGALPGVAVADTIRRVGGGVVDRRELVAVQTPQAFAAGALRRAHGGREDATDDATLVERAGGRIVVVPGEPANLKLTNPEDLVVAEALLRAREQETMTGRTTSGQPAGRRGAGGNLRVGQGYDVHPFSRSPERPLVLGGVRFEGSPGLEGHSDADAVAHAVTDALLGAAGLGDIGTLFPDTDPRYAGADSIALLAEAVRQVRSAGWVPANVDCTVVAEAPRLAPRRAEMEARLTDVVGAPVTVKGKRAEGLGALGRREGIACWAMALVTRQEAW